MMKMEELPSCSFLTAAATRSVIGFVGSRTADGAIATAEQLKPRSLWGDTSPPQQKQTWTETFVAKQHQGEDHFGLPQFILVNSWQWSRDDDAVSDLNSEADFEDEDCLPEATIQVLEAVFGVVPLDDDEDEDKDDEEEDKHGYPRDKEIFVLCPDIRSTANESSGSFSFSLASLDLSSLPDGATGDNNTSKDKETEGVYLPSATFQVVNSHFASLDDHQSENTETEVAHLPNATFQVVKSLFASLDDLDDLSKTSYGHTSVDSRSPAAVLQNVTATTPGVLLFTAVKESIALGGCEFIIPHPKLTSTVG